MNGMGMGGGMGGGGMGGGGHGSGMDRRAKRKITGRVLRDLEKHMSKLHAERVRAKKKKAPKHGHMSDEDDDLLMEM